MAKAKAEKEVPKYKNETVEVPADKFIVPGPVQEKDYANHPKFAKFKKGEK